MLELTSALLFGVPIILSATTLAALHWYPWNRGTEPLNRTTAYALGTAVVVGYPVVSMVVAASLGLPHGELFWAALLIVNALASGATVNTAYWIDGNKAMTLDDAQAATNGDFRSQ